MTSQGGDVPSQSSINACVTMEDDDNYAAAEDNNAINPSSPTINNSINAASIDKTRKRTDQNDTPHGGLKKAEQKTTNEYVGVPRQPHHQHQTLRRRQRKSRSSKSKSSTQSKSKNNNTTTPHSPSVDDATVNNNIPKSTALKPRQLLPQLENNTNNNNNELENESI